MPDRLPTRFTGEQLQRIIEEAMIHMCACPAQVAKEVQQLRDLYAYQLACQGRKKPVLVAVHDRIAESTRRAHAEMEQCLSDVLDMEGWDRATLTMPEALHEVRRQTIEDED